MAGIYIHIPFCRRRCFYCDFYTTVNQLNIQQFVDTLIKEILNKRYFFNTNEIIETLYFGGGTPTLLTIKHYENILTAIQKHFKFCNTIEFTVEANPEDLKKQKCKELKQLGVNRLSIGIQSFNNYILNYLNRKHTSQQAIDSVYNAYDTGIENISIDIIYGIPFLTDDELRKNLEIAFRLPIKHLSAYHLTIEPKTTFSILKDKGKFNEISEEESIAQFYTVHELATEYQFEHYEISNFALPGYRSRHNSNYWLGIPYLGLGPSAHSFDGENRYYNISDLKSYIERINDIDLITKQEKPSITEKINEFILLHLRRKEGLDIQNIQQIFGKLVTEKIINQAQPYIKTGHLVLESSCLHMSIDGWFISDKIISDLFL